MFSYWEKQYWYEKVDYCIIGGGYVGLLTSIFLSEKYPGKKIAIIEAHPIPQGASTKNAGFTCFGSVGELSDDLNQLSEKELVDLVRIRYQGLQLLKQTINLTQCDFLPCGGQEVFVSKTEFDHVIAHLIEANSLMEEAIGISDVFQLKSNLFSSRLYPSVIENRYEGQLNPVKLLKALVMKAKSLGVQIHSGFKVSKWERAEDDNYKIILETCLCISSSELIITSNAFAVELLPELDIIPRRNQVVISEPMNLNGLKGTFHYDRGYVYFRNIGDNRLLIGGARNLDPQTETTSIIGCNDAVINHLIDFAKRNIFKSFVPSQSWSGIIATGKSKFPIISKTKAGPFVAARLGGMGVATGSQVARELVDQL